MWLALINFLDLGMSDGRMNILLWLLHIVESTMWIQHIDGEIKKLRILSKFTAHPHNLESRLPFKLWISKLKNFWQKSISLTYVWQEKIRLKFDPSRGIHGFESQLNDQIITIRIKSFDSLEVHFIIRRLFQSPGTSKSVRHQFTEFQEFRIEIRSSWEFFLRVSKFKNLSKFWTSPTQRSVKVSKPRSWILPVGWSRNVSKCWKFNIATKN